MIYINIQKKGMVKDESSLCIRFTFLSSLDQEKNEILSPSIWRKKVLAHTFPFFSFCFNTYNLVWFYIIRYLHLRFLFRNPTNELSMSQESRKNKRKTPSKIQNGRLHTTLFALRWIQQGAWWLGSRMQIRKTNVFSICGTS